MLVYQDTKKDQIIPIQVENISRIVGYDDCKGFSIVFKNDSNIEICEMNWDAIMKLYHYIKQSEWKEEASRFERDFIKK